MFEEDTSPQPVPNPSSVSRTAVVWLALAIVAVAAGGFFWVRQQNQAFTAQIAALHQQTQKQADDLSGLQQKLHISNSELERLSSVAAETRQNVSQAQQQLASTQRQAATLAQQQQQTVQQIAAVQQDTGSKLGAINGALTGVKGNVETNTTDIAKTKADLDATRAQLKSTIGDLGVQSGLIATTRDELEALKRQGARAYFEFTLNKHDKQPTRVGAISLQLKKVDTKHARYTLDVYADDARIEKKDKNLNEPVQFLVGSKRALNELVVYQMDKNTVTGYVSAPKFADAAAAPAVKNPNR
jgi:chromosome segregation ATPase